MQRPPTTEEHPLSGLHVCPVTRRAALRDLISVMMVELAEAYDKHRDALVRFAASQVGPADAEDVVASAVLGVLRASPTELRDVKAYLYRAVANSAAKHWRGEDRRTRREVAFVRPTSAATSEPSDREIALLSALAALSTQQRAVIHLAYWEDLTPASIAKRLDISDGSVRRQLTRARAHLRKALDAR